jgi:hypothetical protein
MLFNSAFERATRIARTVLVATAVCYAVMNFSLVEVHVQVGCSQNECRTRFFRDGVQEYCTSPGSVLNSRCIKPGVHCYTDTCFFE